VSGTLAIQLLLRADALMAPLRLQLLTGRSVHATPVRGAF